MMLPEDYINRPVRSLQTMLQVLSNVFPALLTVNPDGIYGETTQKAVRAFQRFSGLPETGIAEQETWNSLASCYLRHAPSVLPPEPLRIVLQPGQEIAPGEQNLHLFLMQAMMAALAGRFSNANPPEVTGVFDAATKKAVLELQALFGHAQTGVQQPLGRMQGVGGLGLALEKPLVAIPTVDALAYNLYGTEGLICPLMDARRNQVYTGIYAFESGNMKVLEPQMAVDIEVIAEKLCRYGRNVVFLGDGVPVFRQKLESGLLEQLTAAGNQFAFAPAHVNKQRAGAVGTLALQYIREGRTETADEHQPEYLRMAQAERERAEKEQAAREAVQNQVHA